MPISSDETSVEVRRLQDRLRVLSDATRAFAEATTDYRRLLDVVTQRLADVLGDTCAAFILSDDEKKLVPVSICGPDAESTKRIEQLLQRAPLVLAEHAGARKVVESGEPLLMPQLDAELLRPQSTDAVADYEKGVGIHSLLVVALRLHKKSIGILTLTRFKKESASFDLQDRDLAQMLADHAALAIGNARAYIEARQMKVVAETAKDAARQVRTRFSRLEDAGVLGVVVNDFDGAVVEANETLAKIVGYSRAEIFSEGFDWSKLTPEEWKANDARAIVELRENGVARLREKQYLRKDGSRVWVMAGSASIEGTSQVISFVLDITERKKAEAEAQRLRDERAAEIQRQRHEEQRLALAAIVESAADAIIGTDLDGIITSWNNGAERLFGYGSQEIIGKDISILVPPAREEEKPAIRQAVAHGDVQHADTVRRTKDGRDIDVSVTRSPVHDSSGKLIGTSRWARDITDRRRAEIAIAKAKDEALTANRELEAFSYSVAHDLRAPLRGMNGFAQVLLDGYADKLDAEGRDWLYEIRQNARRMGELIDALLSLSRVTRSPLHRESVDLSAAARASAARLAHVDPNRNVDLEIDPQLRVEADPALTRALLDNLVGNAWKFTTNVASPKISVGTEMKNGEIAYFVRDNGAGFDMTFADKLFTPFQRLHSTTEFPGTGIGLATVQRIVHRHGGRVWAEGEVGVGATFYFTLPNSQAGGSS